jgi:CHAT domain-containing protein
MTGLETLHTHCPDPETLAAFAEGRGTGHERAEIVKHLDDCDDCTTELALALAIENRADRPSVARPRFGWRPLAAAAALLIAVAGTAWWSAARSSSRTSLERLIALAPRTARPVEPRLSGGFAWVAWRGSPRASAEEPDAERMKLIGAAGELVDRARRDRGADAQHTAGVALVMAQDPLAAIEYLERAARERDDATGWNDVAAARYAAAADLQRASLYPEALAAADRALALQPAMPEALFNRALILGRLKLWHEARRAWTRYLEVDPSSPWADEARSRLAALPAATTSSLFERDRARLENAAARGDPAAVQPLVQRYPESSRALAETEYLGEWGAATLRGDASSAQRHLTMARTIGEAVERTSGEALLRESVKAIDAAHSSDRALLADAHARYRRGRLQYTRHQFAEARPELLRAAADLAAARDPMALAARSYAASVRLASGDVGGAEAELEDMLAEVSAQRGFIVLAAQTRWELGRAHLIGGDAPAAIPILAEGAALMHRARERKRAAFIEAILAFALAAAGRGDEGWSAQIRAFDALSAQGAGDELTASIDGAVRTELLAGRRPAALALARLNRAAERADARAADAMDALLQRTLLESQEGNVDEALRAAGRGETLAARVADPILRRRLSADAAFAAGAARAPREPAAARAALTRAIDYYRASELAYALPEPLLLRARCAVRLGDPSSAARDLEEGIRILETRSKAGGDLTVENGPLHAGRALFDDAIRLALHRDDPAGAFALAERSRGGSVGAAGLQRRLSGSGTVVLEIVALPEELLAFVAGEKTFAVSRRPRRRDDLARLAGEELYDDIIRPSESSLERAQALIVVPDPVLATISFAALYDRVSRRYLIEKLPVAIAASATSLESIDPSHPRSLAAMALVSGPETASRGLPEANEELAEVVRLYRSGRALAAGASFADLRGAKAAVIHLAGHTRRQPGGGEQAFLFGAGGALERITWKDVIAAGPIHADVAVLAACETLRPPASLLTRAPSLGGAFLAAGAANVVGTLTTINDADARALFLAFHSELAAGGGAAVALRRVQVAAIRRGADAGAWRSIALMTRSIHQGG